MAEKANIFLIGPTGAGKTTIGKQLAQQLHMELIDSDSMIEEQTGASIDWIVDIEGMEGFMKREESIISNLTERNGIILAAGATAIQSKVNRNHLSARGIVVFLETSIEKQLARKSRNQIKPVSSSDNLQDNSHDNLYRSIADYIVKTDDQNTKTIASKIVSLIETR